MGIASLIVGIAAGALYLISLIPLLGWLNIVVVPLALVGVVLGIAGLVIGFTRGVAATGLVINVIATVLGLGRLF